MKIYTSLSDVSTVNKGGVIAIGNFDGVHKGHQALIAEAAKHAQILGVPCGTLTFEPHPRSLFRPDDAPARITPPALKYQKLAEYGADFIVSLPFDWDFASQSADDFIRNILRHGLGAQHIVVGEDFRFGQLRNGDAALIMASGIPTTALPAVCDDRAEHYSSAVRQALRHGNIDKANSILGWNWEVAGEIVKGDQRGRELGYPTANVKMHDVIHPAYGIYAAFVQIEGEAGWRMAAVNIGIRPMFALKDAQLEAHILDFDADIYGKLLRIMPVKRLRSEAKFDSLGALIAQMDKDCIQARALLERKGTPV